MTDTATKADEDFARKAERAARYELIRKQQESDVLEDMEALRNTIRWRFTISFR